MKTRKSLTILVVAILGLSAVIAVAAYLNHSNKKSNTATVSTATATPLATPVEFQKLTIKEWKVRFPLAENIEDASYKVISNTDSYGEINLYSKALLDASADCGKQYVMVRFADLNAKAADGRTYTAIYGSPDTSPSVVKIGDFYYAWTPGDTTCGVEKDNVMSPAPKVLSDAIDSFRQDLTVLEAAAN